MSSKNISPASSNASSPPLSQGRQSGGGGGFLRGGGQQHGPFLPLTFGIPLDKNASHIPLSIVPYGVLGNFLPNQKGAALVQIAHSPDNGQITFVDAAGLHHVQHQSKTPPGGAARAIYEFVGGILHPITGLAHFPKSVRVSVQKPGDAKFHTYGDGRGEDAKTEARICHVIHAVGPDFRQIFPDPDDGFMDKVGRVFSTKKKKPMPVTQDMLQTATAALAEVYRNTFATFISDAFDQSEGQNGLNSAIQCLRLLPLSSGIFSGPLGRHMHQLTRAGITQGLSRLSPQDKAKLVALTRDTEKLLRIELCIFMEVEFEAYAVAFSPSST